MGFLLIIAYYIFLKVDLVLLSCLDKNVFDFIIVGAGSSGAVVATRLSENANATVLLLEAGKEPLAVSYIPLLGGRVLGGEMNWNYTTVPQNYGGKLFKDDIIPVAQGRALGGSSSVNGMAYTRGNRMDYNTWEKLGNPGWKFSSIFRYFLKLEDYQVPLSKYDADYHHQGGPITVSLPSFKTPLADAFLEAGMEIGQPLVDYNAKYQTGFMISPTNMKNGARCSTYSCYLQPVLERSNLHVLTNAFVTKILLDGKKAVGVEYERQSSTCEVKANKEVIISAGAIRSPQLLMLSGIGPRKTLEKFNIPLVEDVAGVGQNLKDHTILTGISYDINQTISYNSVLKEMDKYLDIWKKSRTGPMTCPKKIEGAAYYQSKRVTKATDWPDIEIQFYSGTAAQIALTGGSSSGDQISFLPFLLRPKSVGEVTLKSKDPHDKPLIDPKYLSHPDDINGLVIAVDLIRKLTNTKAFRRYGAALVRNGIIDNCNSSASNYDEYDRCLVRSFVNTGLHFTSTCKMGPRRDKMAVVDSKLRVYGIQSLRIVDASVMPTIVSAHTSIPCMMIAEKAADMIKHDNRM